MSAAIVVSMVAGLAIDGAVQDWRTKTEHQNPWNSTGRPRRKVKKGLPGQMRNTQLLVVRLEAGYDSNLNFRLVAIADLFYANKAVFGSSKAR
ncbi:hypothetical protein ColLi_12164 [Colletotrichum liriopes]|uniref:Uncharacterized protein n=1 Tax=Colletotrichum liriopes TaxID=708192 RepID=A0AA37GXW1_9PEZI|nr:hypothetical protein ColLi_12164 [Colletotrichum liriopes]